MAERPKTAFDVVIPSLPGYRFSGKPTAPGWDPVTIAKAWAMLMKRLGYTHYVAQGGDWGNALSELMALQQPPGLLGIHTNMAATVPPDMSKALAFHEPPPTDFSPEEQDAWNQLDYFYKNGLGYAEEMSSRPQTLYGIGDSPVGLAAGCSTTTSRSYKMIARVFDGKTEGLSRDDVLDNITLYWLTNTASLLGTSLLGHPQIPPEGLLRREGRQNPRRRERLPRRDLRGSAKLVRKSLSQADLLQQVAKGGHFAAWEQPQLFSEELRSAFRSLR